MKKYISTKFKYLTKEQKAEIKEAIKSKDPSKFYIKSLSFRLTLTAFFIAAIAEVLLFTNYIESFKFNHTSPELKEVLLISSIATAFFVIYIFKLVLELAKGTGYFNTSFGLIDKYGKYLKIYDYNQMKSTGYDSRTGTVHVENRVTNNPGDMNAVTVTDRFISLTFKDDSKVLLKLRGLASKSDSIFKKEIERSIESNIESNLENIKKKSFRGIFYRCVSTYIIFTIIAFGLTKFIESIPSKSSNSIEAKVFQHKDRLPSNLTNDKKLLNEYLKVCDRDLYKRWVRLKLEELNKPYENDEK